MEETQPIQLLFNQLSEELKRDQKSEKVRELLREYMEKHEDWKEYCNFSEDWYARNCVNRNSVLELIVICWNHGQKSFCHNHPSSCWLSVLEVFFLIYPFNNYVINHEINHQGRNERNSIYI